VMFDARIYEVPSLSDIPIALDVGSALEWPVCCVSR
jgi:hypothetical protein